MQNYIITSDTTCDLPLSYTTEHSIEIIPLYYNMDDVVYGDEVNMDPSEFYNKMRNGKMPTTMACNPEVVEKCFRKYLDQGLDVLHISFSSALSSEIIFLQHRTDTINCLFYHFILCNEESAKWNQEEISASA